MDEQEREYLLQQVRQLEGSYRRWKLGLLTPAAVLVFLALLGGISFYMFHLVKPRWQPQEVERGRAAWQAQQGSATGQAVDLTKTNRTIKKEPNYVSCDVVLRALDNLASTKQTSRFPGWAANGYNWSSANHPWG